MMWGNGPHHLWTFLMMCFYATICQCRHSMYQRRNTGGNHITGQPRNQDWRFQLCVCQYKKVSHTIPGKIPLHSPLDSCRTPSLALITGMNVQLQYICYNNSGPNLWQFKTFLYNEYRKTVDRLGPAGEIRSTMGKIGLGGWGGTVLIRVGTTLPNCGSLRRSRCLVAMHNAARDGFCQTECHFEDTYIVLNGNNLNSIIMSSDSTGNYPDYLDVITIFSGNSFCSVKCHRRKLIYILPEHIIEIIPNL